jgi:ketosteroid isomerase-like protein
VAGLSQEGLDYTRDGYRLFAAGDPAFLDRYEPDATIIIPASLPHGGTYSSPLEALEFWNSIPELFENPSPEPEEFIRDGRRLIVLGYFRGRARASGDEVRIRFAHVWGLPDPERPLTEQRYASFELIADTAAFLAAVGAGAG